MGLSLTKIEHFERRTGRKSHSRRWLKNQRNRKIRRYNNEEIPKIGYTTSEY